MALRLSHQQEQMVEQKTAQLIQQAALLFRHPFDNIEIYFDLKGRNLGMYVRQQKQFYIRYNPYVFARHFDDCLKQTTTHEVAHYVCDRLYGLKSIKPHGKEWREVMLALGGEPRVTSTLDITGLPARRYQYFDYQCGCQRHQLSSIRHNKVQRGRAVYRCRECGQSLKHIRL